MGADKKCIPPFMFNLMVRVMEQEGHVPDSLVAGLDLSLKALAQQDTRISFHDALQMIENAYRITGDSTWGLKVGREVNIGDWGMLGYAVASCGTLWEALLIGQRFSRVATRLTDNRAESNDESFSLTSKPLYTAGNAERFLIEEDLGGVVALLQRYLGEEAFPREVHFTYSAPDYIRLYEAHFSCPVKFEQAQNRILWDSAQLERNLPSRNPAATEMAIRHCEALIAEDEERGSIIDRVRSRLVQEPGRYPALNEVASDFNMSESTLRRALKEHDTSFQRILNDVRRKLAIEYLTTSHLKLEEIAVLVGYTDLSNFRRAFKGWTGQAPLEYRRQAGQRR